MTTEEFSVKHSITDKEMADLAREQSRQLQLRSSLEADFKQIKTSYKSKMEEADAGIKRIAISIQGGFEMRTVRCIIANERPEGYRLVIRTDNGHIVLRKKLEQAERQIKLTEVNDPFVAAALLIIDDEQWQEDFFQCPLRADEFEALRGCPDVRMLDLKGAKGLLGPAPGKDEKKGKRK